MVLWSPRSVVSRWVRAEATLADRNKTLVPCTIEPCDRPIMFELTQTAELSHWRGDVGDKAWVAFLSDVKRFVAKAVAAVMEPSAVEETPASPQETLRPGQRGDAPSLAVLPFTNRSGLDEDDVFAVGLVEDVISALSQGSDLRVLGAAATGGLTRSDSNDLAEVGRRLGVRYLMEGNVRRVGTDLRVTAQLLEAESSAVVWAGKFDRPLVELAELQEELVLDLAAALNVEVANLEVARALQKPDDLTAWQLVMTAEYLKWSTNPMETATTIPDQLARALAIAPDYALANAAMAASLGGAYRFSGRDDPEAVQRVRELAARALELAPHDAAVLALVANAYLATDDVREGMRHATRALQKTPGSGMAHFEYGLACSHLERLEEALQHLTTAARLMPGSHMLRLVHWWLAFLNARLGRFSEADPHSDKGLAIFGTTNGHMLKARIALELGDEAEAREHVRIARRTGIPLARIETVVAAFAPNWVLVNPGLRALWEEAEPCG